MGWACWGFEPGVGTILFIQVNSYSTAIDTTYSLAVSNVQFVSYFIYLYTMNVYGQFTIDSAIQLSIHN